MGRDGQGNVVRIYGRKLYDERVTVGNTGEERASTYLYIARGWEDQLKDPLKITQNSANSAEFNSGASSRWEKAGDYAVDPHKRASYYERALRFAKSLPEEERRIKELRLSLKMRRSSAHLHEAAAEKHGVVINMDAYRKKHEDGDKLEGSLRS
jgi:hypothetical protein